MGRDKQNRKIKIFLGAYVNFPNAQNINCDNIARCLDKNVFDVHTMYTHRRPIDKLAYQRCGVHLHRLIHHRWIWHLSKYLTMLLGRYDIYYLPKREPADIAFAKRHRDKLFLASMEGVVGGSMHADNYRAIEYYHFLMNDYFSISKCIQKSVKQHWERDTQVLYLGLNPLQSEPVFSDRVRTVIWTGNIVENKRPEWLLECAKRFPDLSFVMVGDGIMQDEIDRRIREEQIGNVTRTGRIPNAQVYEQLKAADLMLMTSKQEGLPKAIGEAMMSGVPAIYVNECYDVDYIEDGVNGYAVPDLAGMIERIGQLVDDPQKLRSLSERAYETMGQYTWERLIGGYERYFLEQYAKHEEERS